MNLVRIAINVLRVGILVELVLGILFWNEIGTGTALVPVHMFLGLLVVAALWTIGTVQASTKSGSYPLAWGAFGLGLLIALFGLFQTKILPESSAHWIIQVIHLLLGLSAAALGEIMAARYKRSVTAAKAAQAV